jgi:hypothetical protein
MNASAFSLWSGYEYGALVGDATIYGTKGKGMSKGSGSAMICNTKGKGKIKGSGGAMIYDTRGRGMIYDTKGKGTGKPFRPEFGVDSDADSDATDQPYAIDTGATGSGTAEPMATGSGAVEEDTSSSSSSESVDPWERYMFVYENFKRFAMNHKITMHYVLYGGGPTGGVAVVVDATQAPSVWTWHLDASGFTYHREHASDHWVYKYNMNAQLYVTRLSAEEVVGMHFDDESGFLVDEAVHSADL